MKHGKFSIIIGLFRKVRISFTILRSTIYSEKRRLQRVNTGEKTEFRIDMFKIPRKHGSMIHNFLNEIKKKVLKYAYARLIFEIEENTYSH